MRVVRITTPTIFGLIKVTTLLVNFANFTEMSAFTSNTHLVKPRSFLPSEALDHSRHKIYLEENWTWPYIDKLQNFVQTIHKRASRSIGMAPVSVRKKHVLHLIAIAIQKQFSKTTAAAEPRYNFSNKVRIASRNMPFRKSYLQPFGNELFTTETIPSHMQPTSYTLRDAQNI